MAHSETWQERHHEWRTLTRSTRQLMILGLLVDRPSYVYDVARRFDELYGDVLPTRIPQVYRSIDALVQKQLIEVLPARDAGHTGSRTGRHYGPTRKGRSLFARLEWRELLYEPVVDEVRLRLAVLQGVGSIELIRMTVDRFEEFVLEARRELESALAKPARPTGGSEPGDASPDLSSMLLELRLVLLAIHRHWLEVARKLIDQHVSLHGSIRGGELATLLYRSLGPSRLIDMPFETD